MSKKSTKEYLIDISHNCYKYSSNYKFAKHQNLGTQKHKEGVITVLNWVNELCYHYLQEEQKIQSDFKKHISDKQKIIIDTLSENEYKKGIIEGFKIVDRITEDKV
jgi:hypothetical protein